MVCSAGVGEVCISRVKAMASELLEAFGPASIDMQLF